MEKKCGHFERRVLEKKIQMNSPYNLTELFIFIRWTLPIIQQSYLSLYFITFLSCREHLFHGSYHLFINLYLQMAKKGKKIRKSGLQEKPRKNTIFLVVFSLQPFSHLRKLPLQTVRKCFVTKDCLRPPMISIKWTHIFLRSRQGVTAIKLKKTNQTN